MSQSLGGRGPRKATPKGKDKPTPTPSPALLEGHLQQVEPKGPCGFGCFGEVEAPRGTAPYTESSSPTGIKRKRERAEGQRQSSSGKDAIGQAGAGPHHSCFSSSIHEGRGTCSPPGEGEAENELPCWSGNQSQPTPNRPALKASPETEVRTTGEPHSSER